MCSLPMERKWLRILCTFSTLWLKLFAVDDSASMFLDSSSLSSTQKYLILHIERLGLANRLRSIADWYHLAGLSNRKLLLSWVPTAECNATFNELFEDGPSNFDVLSLPLPIGNSEAISAASALATNSHVTFETLLTRDSSSRAEMNYFFEHSERFLLFQDITVLFTNFDAPIVLPGTPCPSHLSMRSSFYSSLIPVSEIRSTVKEIHSNYFQNRSLFSFRSLRASPYLTSQSDDRSTCSDP
jgi:hypothetical protein